MRKSVSSILPETVSFRLPDTYMDALMKQAARGQNSPGECARQILIDYLEDGARERLETELRALQAEITFLRGDFATAVEALLVLAGAGSVSPTESQAWVEERLRQVRTRET